MNITNGQVEFERVTRPADFESKRAKVVLSFAIADGEDAEAVVANVGEMAKRRALTLVGEVQAPAAKPAARPPKAAEEIPPNLDLMVPPQTPTGSDTSTVEGNSQSASPDVTDAVLKAAFIAARERHVTGDQINEAVFRHTQIVGAKSHTLDLTDPRRRLLLADIEALKADGPA